jgi:hypothetical protein
MAGVVPPLLVVALSKGALAEADLREEAAGSWRGRDIERLERGEVEARYGLQ